MLKRQRLPLSHAHVLNSLRAERNPGLRFSWGWRGGLHKHAVAPPITVLPLRAVRLPVLQVHEQERAAAEWRTTRWDHQLVRWGWLLTDLVEAFQGHAGFHADAPHAVTPVCRSLFTPAVSLHSHRNPQMRWNCACASSKAGLPCALPSGCAFWASTAARYRRSASA